MPFIGPLAFQQNLIVESCAETALFVPDLNLACTSSGVECMHGKEGGGRPPRTIPCRGGGGEKALIHPCFLFQHCDACVG